MGRAVVLACAVSLACIAAHGSTIPPDLEDATEQPGERRRGERSDRPGDRDAKGKSTVSSKSLVDSASSGGDDGPGTASVVAVPRPHPMISEVLYAVPTGADGDADQDGKRHSAGDEFIEVFNPHDVPIGLSGYTLTDGTDGESKFRFVFPALSLEPGEVVVVFNGYEAGPEAGGIKGAMGGPSRDERFGNAYVFCARVTRRGVAFSNEGDMAVLTAPDGTIVHRVAWGSMAKPGKSRTPAIVDDVAPDEVRAGSVQRRSAMPGEGNGFAEHRVLGTPTPSNIMSPGWYVPPKPAAAAPAKSRQSAGEDATTEPSAPPTGGDK